jgi:hypothetical protein
MCDLEFQGNEKLAIIYFLFLFFGLSALPMAYWMSFLFKTSSSAYARLFMSAIVF